MENSSLINDGGTRMSYGDGKAVRELSKWEDLMLVYGGRIFEKCGINRDEAGIYEKTRYLSGNCWA